MVLYGIITDPSALGSRVSYGTINWVLQPAAGGTPVAVSGVVTNIHDQFSYVLRIPCETQIGGQPVSTGALMLASSPTTYNCVVTVSGVAASFAQPSQANLTMLSTDRGRLLEVDLMANLNGTGLLPPDWQFQYFGHLGVDPLADPDGDGMNNYQEYIAGTNPLDPQSRFQILHVRPDPTGAFVDWSSVAGKSYTLQRSSSLVAGFADVQNGITATAPLNTFHDTNSAGGGPYFYRVRIE